MASYVAAGVPAQIVRVSNTTLFSVSAQYLGDAMYWTRIALINGIFDPWITALTELKIPVGNPAWPTDGILGAWSDPTAVVATPAAATVAPATPTPPTITMADLQALIPYLPTTLPSKPGVLWVDGGMIALS